MLYEESETVVVEAVSVTHFPEEFYLADSLYLVMIRYEMNFQH